MRTFDNIEALVDAVGDHLGHSPWLSIDQDRINTFGDATGDHRGSGAMTAHGNLALSLVPPLLKQVYEVRNVAMSLNYGTNRIRFSSSVLVDSRIRVHARLLATTRVSMGQQFVIEASVEQEGTADPVCIAELVLLLVGQTPRADLAIHGGGSR